MPHLKEKFRVIFIPFLIVAIAFLAGYTFLNWLLTMRTDTISVREDISDIWVPLLLPYIPVLIWVGPRLKLLKLNNKKGQSSRFSLEMLLVLAIAAPTIVAQKYIQTATGKLAALKQASEMTTAPPAKFYTLQHHFIYKAHPATKYAVTVTGKRRKYLDLDIYIASLVTNSAETITEENLIIEPPADATAPSTKQHAPAGNPLIVINDVITDFAALSKLAHGSISSYSFLKDSAATALYGNAAANGVVIVTTKPVADTLDQLITPRETPLQQAWLCVNYHKRISNDLSREEKMQKRKDFYSETMDTYQKTDLNEFVYLERMGNNKERDQYRAAIEKLTHVKQGNNNMLFIAKTTAFSERNGNKLLWIPGALLIGLVVILGTLVNVPIHEDKMANHLNGTTVKESGDNKELLAFFKPHPGFYITPVIMYANIIVFILMACAGLGFLDFSRADLLKWGANYGPYTTNHQWWRLFTSTFLHGGIVHLLANMYGLLFVGVLLEPRTGRNKFAAIYVACGVLASLASMWWHPAVTSVGASGAIFGLYGAALALLLLKVFPKELSKPFLLSTSIFIAYNLVMGLANGIDNAAHIGGVVSGFIIGLLLAPSIKNSATVDIATE